MCNILVCMKAVPVTPQVRGDGAFCLQRSEIDLQWNVADMAALEAALCIRGQTGLVTVLTMGPKKLEGALQELLARGADRAVLLTDPLLAGSDTYATAIALVAAARALGTFDLVLCGRRTMDGETAQIPGMLAGALCVPCVTNAESVVLAEKALRVQRRLETGTAALEVQLPAVISLCEYSYQLRLPGILTMRKARQKQVEILTADTLGVEARQCGLRGSLTKVESVSERFPGLRKGPKQTDIAAGVKSVLRFCREVK